MHSAKKDSPQETVLLRHAQPKYGFQGKKLDKKPSKPKSPSITGTSQLIPKQQTSSQPSPKHQTQSLTTAALPKPSATLPAHNLITPGIPSSASGLPAQKTYPVSSNHQQLQNYHFADHDSRTKTASIVKPLTASGVAGKYQAPYTASQSIQLPQKPIQIISPVQGATASETNCSHVGVSVSNPLPTPSAAILKLEQELGLVRPSHEDVASLRKENERLKQDLDVQIKVNSELKKLLVASVGEDLERRVERLARDKAELSNEVGGYSKKVSQDYENLDKVSIQADMWRSKFLASRVMIDELASARAFYALQYQESQDALQQLLTERHELRANLLEMFKCLQQVKGAFDPLNAHKSVTLPSTNVIDLARNSQQLSEAIRYRLLPGQLNMSTVLDIDSQLENCRTPAENFAEELMARQTSLDPVQKSVSGNLFGPTASGSGSGSGSGSRIERYHPDARFDNLTMNCCNQCKGDLSVL